jgi:hypothetical protein
MISSKDRILLYVLVMSLFIRAIILMFLISVFSPIAHAGWVSDCAQHLLGPRALSKSQALEIVGSPEKMSFGEMIYRATEWTLAQSFRDQEQMANALEKLLLAISEQSPKDFPWTFRKFTGKNNGAIIFRGPSGHSLVLTPTGGLLKGYTEVPFIWRADHQLKYLGNVDLNK